MRIRKGQAFYGQDIGVLVFDGQAPRIPGDPGHAESFSFGVRYATVQGSFMDLVDGSEQIREALHSAVLQLKAEGVSAIVGDCGLMSLYQKELAEVAGLPVAASSLVLLPSLHALLGAQASIGILTGHRKLLHEKHLRQSGWNEAIPLVIQGMEQEEAFSSMIMAQNAPLDPLALQGAVLRAAKKLMAQTSAFPVRAIILECSNLGSYAKAVQDCCQVPVYDMISLTQLLHAGLHPPSYLSP